MKLSGREKGTLPIGIEYEGKVHKDFVIRPQLVRDSVEVMEDERAVKNDHYAGVCFIAKQLDKLGTVPKKDITPELIMSLVEVDMEALLEAKGALERRLASFRGEKEGAQEGGPGAP